MPSLYLRGRIWWFAYRHWTGQRKARSTGVRERAVAARIAQHVENQHALAREGLIDPDDIETSERGRMPVKTVLRDYLAGVPNDQKSIVEAFLDQSNIQIAAEFGSRAITTMIHQYIEQVGQRDVQHRRVQDHLRAIVSAGEWLRKHGYIRANRARDVELAGSVDQPKVRHRALRPHELHAIAGLPHGIWYRFCVFTGLRGAEAIQIERRDLDLTDKPTLTVRADVAKNQIAWTVPISRRMADLLAAHCHMRPGPVFPEMPGRRDTRRSWLKRDLKAAGISDPAINVRSFRMSHKSWLQAAEVDAETIAHLRRDKGRGTERLRRTSYTDAAIVDPVLRSAVERLETWFEGEMRATACATS